MKISMLPHLQHFREGQSGIKRVVEAYFKYMPSMGVEFLDPEVEGWDLRVSHAGMTDKHCDVAILHGLYWSADYQSQHWEWHTNARVIRAIRNAKEVTVPSNWVAETFQRDMRFSPHVIPHGIDWEDWQHDYEHQKYVLWNKNRAFDVCDPLPVTELAKRFPDVGFITTFARQNPPKNVNEIGLQPHSEMKNLIQHAGVYLSSTKETFGIGTLEAMASGVPVLGFDHGGNRDLVEHGINGYLAQPNNFDDLAEGLLFCIENRSTLGTNGREMAKKWTWEVACEKMIDVWKQAMVEEEPTVSVIIPSYNYADKIGRAIESVQNQTYDKVSRIIVVDDGSEDSGKTSEIVQELSRSDGRINYVRQENSGVAVARNRGIREAGFCKYVCCLDADDAIEPEFLRACIEGLEADRSLGIAYTGLRWIKPDGSTGISEWPGEYDYDEQIQRRNQIPTCCVFRRKIWERLGGYKSRYCPTGAGSEDAEYWTRVGSIGYSAKKVTTAPLFIYSWQSGHTSQQGYSEVDWLLWHPWTRDHEHPFASVATPKNKISHAVRQYDEPLVSVIIPVGPGHEEVLENAIDSVEGQTFRKWELIVIADTVEIPERFKKAHPYIKWLACTGKKCGAGEARNLGVMFARAPFLLFLDADDWLDPNCIEEMLEEWRREEAIIYSDYIEKTTVHDPEKYKANLKGAKIYEENGHDFVVGRRSAEYEYERAIQQPKEPYYLWNLVTSLVPKSWHEAIGGFDEKMPSWEDWDYYLRFARAGYCFRRIPKELVIYRFTTGTRRYSAAADTPEGRQLAQSLIEYLKDKYKEIDVVGCRCKDKKRRTPSPLTVPASRSNGGTELVDNNFVMCKYTHPNRGQHQVVGAATKTKYGHRGGGSEFLVHVDDIAAQPHIFQPMEGQIQPPPQPIAPPNQPVPVEVEVVQAEQPAGLMGVDVQEEPSVIEGAEMEFQLIPGVTKAMADQFIADGLKTKNEIAMLGIEGLTKYSGIGEVKAEKIINAIVALQRR